MRYRQGFGLRASVEQSRLVHRFCARLQFRQLVLVHRCEVTRNLNVLSGQNAGIYRIIFVEQENPGIAYLDRDLQVLDEALLVWHHVSAVKGVRFRTTKFTDLAQYRFEARHLLTLVSGRDITEGGAFTAQNIPHPQLLEVEPQDDGSLIVTYDDEMRMDESVGNPGDYVISGPTDVREDWVPIGCHANQVPQSGARPNENAVLAASPCPDVGLFVGRVERRLSGSVADGIE